MEEAAPATWTLFVKAYQRIHDIPYQAALIEAAPAWRAYKAEYGIVPKITKKERIKLPPPEEDPSMNGDVLKYLRKQKRPSEETLNKYKEEHPKHVTVKRTKQRNEAQGDRKRKYLEEQPPSKKRKVQAQRPPRQEEEERYNKHGQRLSSTVYETSSSEEEEDIMEIIPRRKKTKYISRKVGKTYEDFEIQPGEEYEVVERDDGNDSV